MGGIKQALLAIGFWVLAGAWANLLAADQALLGGDWSRVRALARGQTVYFSAWGGEAKINAFIGWAGAELRKRAGVTLVHVKVADTAEVVARVIAEAAGGRKTDGTVDLVWINGKNFKALKERNLLFGPFLADLPASRALDLRRNPTLASDSTLPTEGYEAPWGLARLTFFHDEARDWPPPRDLDALLAFARMNPGRFTYPQPPDFLGVTFLKQVMLMRATDRTIFAKPASDEAFGPVAGAVFAYLDALHPHLWRGGRTFPSNVAQLRQLFADGEVRLAFTFNPADPATAVDRGEMPASVRSFGLAGGTIGNAHFLAVPANASAKAGALVAIDFLLSPEAQARKASLAIWGDPTVLALDALDPADRVLFAPVTGHPSFPTAETLGPALEEPHPSWGERLEAEWRRRYSGG